MGFSDVTKYKRDLQRNILGKRKTIYYIIYIHSVQFRLLFEQTNFIS